MKKLGKYEILSELGHGAMGVVYKARDPLINRSVALKTINPSLVDRPDLLERFYQEAQSAGKLQHPNIITIFELGKAEDTPYIAMEFIDGESLEKCISRRRELPLALKVGYIVRICQALGYAHKNRVVHRDIKPANIMVDSQGVVKVVDFGIARLIDFSRTNTSMMIGTPAYMAPELFNQGKADDRSDIWAVGVTHYELICARRPFSGDGYGLIRSINEDAIADPSSIAPDCPAELAAVIRRMLQKNRAERYLSMEDVLMDLEPVWNRLRTDSLASLTQRAEELYRSRELAKAEELLHTARLVDPSDKRAKSLLETVSTELRRSQILPKVKQHLTRGQAFLKSRQFREAQAEAEAALSLDSRNEVAGQLAEEAGAALRAQAQRELQQRINEIRSKINRQELSDAIHLAEQSLHEFGPDTDVTQLLQAAQVELQEREKKDAQLRSQSSVPAFNPTDVLSEPSASSSSGETVGKDVTLIMPTAPGTPAAPAPALASATHQMEAAVPVLTPPPTPQPRIVPAQEQVRLEVPPKEVHVPRRRAGFPGRSMLAWTAFIVVFAAATYKYASVRFWTRQPQQTTQQAAPEKPSETAANTESSATLNAKPNAGVTPPAAAPGGVAAPDEQRSNTSLTQAIAAFNRHDYATAKSTLDQAVAGAPQNWSKSSQAAALLVKTQNRISQQQHLTQAQSLFNAGRFDAAKAEASQAVSSHDADPVVASAAATLIARVPYAAAAAPQPPAKPAEPAPKDFRPLVDSISAAINQGQLDDAQSKLNTLPADYPNYNSLKQSLADARDDQAFSQKKSELTQAENTKNESALRASRDYFNTLASQPGRHSAEARSLTTEIDNDLKPFTAANTRPGSPPSAPNANSPASNNSSGAVAASNDDVAAIRAVLDAYAKALDSGDLSAVKAVRQIAPSDEKRFVDGLKLTKGKGFVFLNCSRPETTGDTARVSCETALNRSKDASKGHTNLFLTRTSGRWSITSTN